tara:strand:- start:422 stop:1027 length:606 start_codon:yes stop_codon:yes gene_type:complete
MSLLPNLTREEKESLLLLARDSLTSYLLTKEKSELSSTDIPLSKQLETPYGCFVTLTKNNDLRGCIGTIIPTQSLAQHVLENVLKSAFEDFRFSPVTTEELHALHIEITVLSPNHPIESYQEIVLGTHGIILEKEGCRALFLPQVAIEQGWTVDETLTHLARKAGLDPNAWKEPDCRFFVFEGLVFSENDLFETNDETVPV